jgi:hypothetical protein
MFAQAVHLRACLRAKRRFVCSPGLLISGTTLPNLFLLTFGFSLGSFLLIKLDGFGDGSLGQSIPRFRRRDQAKSTLEGVLKEIEQEL